MGNKPTLKYRVVSGRNPKTGGVIQRPVITDRETYYIDQVVEYAINAGYVRGQFHDMRGALNGFIEAMQQLGKAGKAVNLSNWLRIHAELTGQVGETRQLTEANVLHVAITALTELKANVSDFSWVNVEDTGIVPKVDTLMYIGATKGGEIRKSTGIIATGRNLQYSASLGDSVVLNWIEGTEAKTATIVPTESDYSHQKFDWPTALADVPVGTTIAFTFTLHGGVEGGAAYTVTKSAKLIAAA